LGPGDMGSAGSAEEWLVLQVDGSRCSGSCQDLEKKRLVEVESNHWQVQGSHLAGKGVAVVEVGLEDQAAGVVEAFDVVEDHVDLPEVAEAQDLGHLVFPPLFRRIGC
jgi:hypothetical protein